MASHYARSSHCNLLRCVAILVCTAMPTVAGNSTRAAPDASHAFVTAAHMNGMLQSVLEKLDARFDRLQHDLHDMDARLAQLEHGMDARLAQLQAQLRHIDDTVSDITSSVITARDFHAATALGNQHVWQVDVKQPVSAAGFGSGFLVRVPRLGIILLTCAHVLCPAMDQTCYADLSAVVVAVANRRADTTQLVCVAMRHMAETWVKIDLWPMRCDVVGTSNASTANVSVRVSSDPGSDPQRESALLPALELRTDIPAPGSAILALGVATDMDAELLDMYLPLAREHALQLRAGVILPSLGRPPAIHGTMRAGAWLNSAGSDPATGSQGAAAIPEHICRVGAGTEAPVLRGSLYSDARMQIGMSGGPAIDKRGRVVGVNTGLCGPASLLAIVPTRVFVRTLEQMEAANALANVVHKIVKVATITGIDANGKPVVGVDYVTYAPDDIDMR